ncbi:MAG: hypothetical protein WCJ29_02375 [bacterium]
MSAAPRVRFYRNIVGTFVALNIVLLVFVVYLSFVKATIHVTPKDVSVSKQFIADVSAKPAKPTEVPGMVVAKMFEKSKLFQVTEGKESLGKSTGKIVIHNGTANAQTWRATTRFLSKDGVLFRTPVAVTIPANGEREITVVADAVGPLGDVEPGKFTVPALAANLQEKIYGESKVAFTGGIKKIAAVTQEALDAAKKELAAEIYAEAQTQIATESKGNFTDSSFTYELGDSRSDTTPGTEADQFNVNVKLKVIGVFYDAKSLLVLAKAKLFESLSDELMLGEVDSKNIKVELDKYDLETLIANVKVTAIGSALLKDGGSILNKDKVVGLSVKDAVDYLKGFEEVKDARIEMRPFWVSKLPKLKDHIEFVIEK